MCVCTFDGCPPAQSSYTLNVQDKRIPLWESCEHMWLHFSDYMWLHVGMHYLACITFAYKYDINVRVPATTRAKTVNSFGFCLCQYPGGTHLVVVISLSVHVVNFLWFYKKWKIHCHVWLPGDNQLADWVSSLMLMTLERDLCGRPPEHKTYLNLTQMRHRRNQLMVAFFPVFP